MSPMLKIVVPAVVIVLALLAQSAFIVNEPEQGLILQFGKHVRTISEPGLYFKYPIVQEYISFDKRVLFAEARPAEYVTLDKKRLTVDTVSRWKIVDPLRFFQSVRDEQAAIFRLNDIIIGWLRQEVANHNFQDFIREKRESIMNKVTKGTEDQAEQFGINVIDVRIRRVDLPEEVQASVFARMKAERERIAKRYRAEGDEQAREIRANAQKDNEIIFAEAYRQSEALRGEGDAEATGIYAEAYGKNPEFYSFLRHMETYKKLFGAETTMLLRPGSDLLRFLDSPGQQRDAGQAPGASSNGK
jgi:modulator of FtsH protease HflC